MVSSVKNILYTGAFRFPDGDAAAYRVHSIGQLLASQGYEVSFAGWENGPTGKGEYEFNGFRCYPQKEFRTHQINPISRFLGFLLRGHRTFRWLLRKPKYDVVIAYNPPAIFALALLVLGKARGFVVVLDSTEWYEGSHLPGGAYGLAAVENWIRMNVSYPRFANVIAISSFLRRKFDGRNVVRIPPLIDFNVDFLAEKNLAEVIKFVYAGNAGQKDKLLPFIRALPALAERVSRRVELHLAGPSLATLAPMLDAAEVSEEVRKMIVFHGHLSRTSVFELYRNCHFSILFREDARYAWAGFPTKAMESWAFGCPIITNAVGDLRDLARSLHNAIVVEERGMEEALCAAMGEILGSGLYPKMVADSRHTARAEFSAEAYAKLMAEFVGNF